MATGRTHGFTVTELLATLAITSILGSIAVPAFSQLRRFIAATTTFHALTASLTYTRSTAITQRSRVTVCPSRDGQNCDYGSDWSMGWMVFRDPRNVGQPVGQNAILQVHASLPAGMRALGTTGRPLVRYLPSGRASGSNLTIEVCNADAVAIGAVVVNNSGRVRSERYGTARRCRRA